MKRVGLVASEPIRPRLGGIGVRYLEMTRWLPPLGFEVSLLSPGTSEEAEACGLAPTVHRRFDPAKLGEWIAGHDVVVAQGQLANDVVLAAGEVPVAIDLYDPWLVENLQYAQQLGLAPWKNDHASWMLQLAAGDFFLCSSEEQRLYYLGLLTAAGRVNPELAAVDPDFATLVAVVPFGVSPVLEAHRPWLPPRRDGERRLLFGGLYDWYDPWTLLDALERLPDFDWTLRVVRNPNPESTPQRLFAELERRARARGWWESRVLAIDWVPAERRYDLLRDVDALVAPHRASLETRLAFRTRFLDALAAGCPVVTSEGGALSRRLAECAGWVVPEADPDRLAAALRELLTDDEERRRRVEAGRLLAREFAWERVLAPLVRFLADPRRESSKLRFAARLPTASPDETPIARLRRRVRRFVEGGR
ncbi:MAG: glycosyltransferase family 4 protein [Thermoanaerobaculia bacterium]